MRVLLYVVGLLLAIVILVVACVPSFLSTEMGRDWTVSAINSNMNGKVEVKSFNIGWFSGLRIDGVRVATTDGEFTATLERLDSDATLWTLATGGLNLGDTHIDKPFIRIVRKAGELGLPAPEEPEHPPVRAGAMEMLNPFVGKLVVSDGRIELVQEGRDTITIDNIHVNVASEQKSGPLVAELSAESEQGAQTGKMSVKATISGFDANGRMKMDLDDAGMPRMPQGAQCSVEVKLDSLPVAAFDRMLGINKLVAALGEQLNVHVNNVMSANSVSVDVQVQSTNLTAHFVGDTTPQEFRLTQPSEVKFTVTPAFLPDLSAPTVLTWKTDRFSIPLEGNHFRPAALNIHSQLDLAKTKVKLPGSGTEQTVDTLTADFDSGNIAKEMRLKVSSTGAGSSLSVQGVIRGLLEEGRPSLEKATVELKAIVDHFPVALIDRELVEALGGQLSAAVEIGGGVGDISGRISINADRFHVDGLNLHWKDDLLTLQGPATIQMTASPALVSRFAPDVVLARAIDASVEIKDFQLPCDLGQPFVFNPKQTSLELVAKLPDVDVTYQNQHQIAIKDGQLTLSGKTLADSNFELTSGVSSKTLPPALGLPGTVYCTGRLLLGSFGIEDLTAQIKTSTAELAAAGRLDNKGTVTTAQPISLSYKLTPEIFPGLTKSATALLVIDPFSLPVSPFDLGKVTIKGHGHLDALTYKGTNIDKGELNWAIDVAKSTASIDIAAQAQAKDAAASTPLHAVLTATQWAQKGKLTPDSAKVNAKVDLAALPIAFAESFTGMGQLVTLVGQTMELHVDATLSSVSPMAGSADVQARGDGLDFHTSLAVEGERIRTRDSSTLLTWQLTPARLKVLMEDKATLDHPASIELAVTELAFPYTWDVSNPQLRDIVLNATGTIKDLRLTEKVGQQSVQFDLLKLSGGTQDLAKETHFQLTGRGQSSAGSTMQMDLSGSFGDLLKDNGDWNWAGATTSIDADLKQIPAALLSALAGFDPGYNEAVAALFGKQLNATAKGALSRGAGTLAATLDSDNSDARFDGRLENGILKLNAPMTGTLHITRELSNTILKDINPLLISAVSADAPVKFTMETEGFSIQVLPFDISKANFLKATIEFQKLILDNGGPLGLLVGITTLQGLSSLKQMEVWFTPQYLSMRNGVAKLERMDALAANQFHICTWGTIDVPGDYVDMTSGILGVTLRRSFGVRNVADDYVLQTRMTGATSKVDIPTTKLLAQITALKAGGGGIGQLVGGVLGGGGGKVPDPTTQPFPWADVFPPPGDSGSTQSPNDDQQNTPSNGKFNPLDLFKKF